MTTFSRRNLLKAGGTLLGGAALAPLALSSKAAKAQAAPAVRKLVMVLNAGGWDPTVALDPKPGEALIDVVPGALRTVDGVTYWSDASRPAVDTFMDRWAARACVVNGVQVRSFVHTDCMKRMLTGSPSEVAPDMGAIAAF